MILPFMDKFPDKEPTHFKELILEGVKKHSMRLDPLERWMSGRRIDMAYHNRTKQMEIFHRTPCISTQKALIEYNGHGGSAVGDNFRYKGLTIVVNSRRLFQFETEALIANDGLSYERFVEHFFKGKEGLTMYKIIHWTDLRY